MKKSFTFKFLLFFTFYFSSTNAADIAANSELGPCICDLTASVCDVNCCCDSDCSQLDRNTFAYCNANYSANPLVCISNEVIFIQNAPFSTEVTSNNQLCISNTSYSSRNYYNTPTLTTDYGAFSYNGFPTSRQTFNGPSSFQFVYLVGKPIYVYYSTDTIGTVALPKFLLSGQCNDANNASYLQSESTSCPRAISTTACTSASYFNVNSFVSGFRVASQPNIFYKTTNQSQIGSFYLSADLVNVTYNITCKDQTGAVVNCSTSVQPALSGSVCQNVLQKINYVVTYSPTAGIQLFTATAELSNVDTATTTSMKQYFSIKFVSSASTTTVSSAPRSGNPGYRFGSPVLAGTLSGSSVILNSDANLWWTVAGRGNCLSPNRQSVLFGNNFRSGCYLQLNDSINSYCSYLQTTILTALRGSAQPNRVAMFGNSSVSVLDDWLTVLESDNVNQQPSVLSNGCSNIIVGVDVRIVYSRVGAVVNPQNRIIGVNYNYRRGDMRYMCGSAFCQANSGLVQTFEIVSSVTFVDVSSTPISVEQAPAPLYLSRLAYDFFYPIYVEWLGPS